MLLLPLGLYGAVPPCHARSLGWLRDGAVDARFGSGQVEVPLFRGPTTRYLPSVQVDVPVGDEIRPVLAVLDLGGAWSRVSPEVANTLGFVSEFVKFQGVWRHVVEVPEVRVRDLVLIGLRVEITEDAPGFVLGVGSLPEVAVALVPSEGVVRWVPAKYGPGLVEDIGTPIAATRQPAAPFANAEGRVRGDGLTLRVPGALRWGAAVADGSFHVRTDLVTSRVAPSKRLPDATMRAGEPFHDVGVRLGDVWLSDAWMREAPSVVDPAPDFTAALGYDVLFGLDIAVAPGPGLVAFRKARGVSWQNATQVSVEFARTRYNLEEARYAGTPDATSGPKEERVVISFDSPKGGGPVLLGDKGNPLVRDRNLDLAETLWFAGALDDAIPFYDAAARYAGDQCAAHLILGERRLAQAGAKLMDDTIGKLVVDPIDRAAHLWDTWLSLDEGTRTAVTEGRSAPGALQVWQPMRCRLGYGLLTAVDRMRGKLDRVDAIEQAHLSAHPAIAYTRGLVALSEGRFGAADPLLSVASAVEAVDPVDLQIAVARAKAGQGQLDLVQGIAVEVPGYVTDHPLTVALGILEAARLSNNPAAVTKKMVRADDRWVPGQLAHALATGVPPPAWDPAVDQRAPGSPQVACQRAVHLALSGNLLEATYTLKLERWPGFADWWAASAVVASLAGEMPARDEAILNLKLRFPLLPVGTLGL